MNINEVYHRINTRAKRKKTHIKPFFIMKGQYQEINPISQLNDQISSSIRGHLGKKTPPLQKMRNKGVLHTLKYVIPVQVRINFGQAGLTFLNHLPDPVPQLVQKYSLSTAHGVPRKPL